MQFKTAVDEDPADLDFRRHLSQLETGVLEVRDRLAERLAVAGVIQRPLQAGLG
ncbi:hypothetical protein D3C81_2328170 [compost metagenome]